MKNAMIKLTTKATAAMLVAATVFTTVAPTAYAAETTAVVAEVQGAELEADWVDVVWDIGTSQPDKDSGWARIINYVLDSIFG